jgi:hypothetical protein
VVCSFNSAQPTNDGRGRRYAIADKNDFHHGIALAANFSANWVAKELRNQFL